MKIDWGHGITIEKGDIIRTDRMEGGKISIRIKSKKEDFRIDFEDADTCDYFIEKLKNDFDKIRLNLNTKADRIRLKILQIERGLAPLQERVRK
jgi:hypothetical protein